MGLIAINTGHNLFHLIFGLLLGMVIISGMLSERVLRGIECRRRLPSEITSRSPFAVVLEIRNPHPSKISYSLIIRDGGDFFSRRTLGYVPSLQPGEVKTFHYLVQAGQRGRHQFEPVHIVTRFPFGLFEKTRIIPLQDHIIAYPGIRETTHLHDVASGGGETGNKKRRWGEEILGLRPALPEDDHRLIHWRTSARMGQLMAKEFIEEIEQPRALFFDDRGGGGERFEQAVEVAATLLRLIAARGVPVTFSTWDDHFEAAGPDHGLTANLRRLALIAPSRSSGRKGYEKWLAKVGRNGGGIFLRTDARVPSSLPPCEVIQP